MAIPLSTTSSYNGSPISVSTLPSSLSCSTNPDLDMENQLPLSDHEHMHVELPLHDNSPHNSAQHSPFLLYSEEMDTEEKPRHKKRTFSAFSLESSHPSEYSGTSSEYLPLKVQKTRERTLAPLAFLDPDDIERAEQFARACNMQALKSLLKPESPQRFLLSEIPSLAQSAAENQLQKILAFIRATHLLQSTVHTQVPSFNPPYFEGWSPLVHAAFNRNKEMIFFLLDNGAHLKAALSELGTAYAEEAEEQVLVQEHLFSTSLFLNSAFHEWNRRA